MVGKRVTVEQEGMRLVSACKLKLMDARMSCCTSAFEACNVIAKSEAVALAVTRRHLASGQIK